jgi:hypothetical protein
MVSPTFSCEKPTSISSGVGVRSQISTTGVAALRIVFFNAGAC